MIDALILFGTALAAGAVVTVALFIYALATDQTWDEEVNQ